MVSINVSKKILFSMLTVNLFYLFRIFDTLAPDSSSGCCRFKSSIGNQPLFVSIEYKNPWHPWYIHGPNTENWSTFQTFEGFLEKLRNCMRTEVRLKNEIEIEIENGYT